MVQAQHVTALKGIRGFHFLYNHTLLDIFKSVLEHLDERQQKVDKIFEELGKTAYTVVTTAQEQYFILAERDYYTHKIKELSEVYGENASSIVLTEMHRIGVQLAEGAPVSAVAPGIDTIQWNTQLMRARYAFFSFIKKKYVK